MMKGGGMLMKKYTKPSVKKVKTDILFISQKGTFCSGNNSRKMPQANFTKK